MRQIVSQTGAEIETSNKPCPPKLHATSHRWTPKHCASALPQACLSQRLTKPRLKSIAPFAALQVLQASRSSRVSRVFACSMLLLEGRNPLSSSTVQVPQNTREMKLKGSVRDAPHPSNLAFKGRLAVDCKGTDILDRLQKNTNK
jgi:hypothetical protein